jgi:hypothetical protein
MSFGQHAVVLEPEILRVAIVKELNALLAGYADSEERSAGPRLKRVCETIGSQASVTGESDCFRA